MHPAIDDITVEAIFHALSDPSRVGIFAQIVGSERPQSCSDFLCACDKDIPKSTLSQHFKVLREAGLIRSERHGVEMLSWSRQDEIDKRFPGLIAAIAKAHRVQSGPKKARVARSA
jgi:DNA-binding transcriptional ArsR family regulator